MTAVAPHPVVAPSRPNGGAAAPGTHQTTHTRSERGRAQTSRDDRVGMLPPAVANVSAMAAVCGLADDTTVTLLPHGEPAGPDTLGSAPAAVADVLQLEHGEGPGLTAAITGELTVVEDLTGEARWARWTPDAARLGVGAVLSVPLPGINPAGSLNLWSHTPRHWSDADVDRVRHLAAVTGALLHLSTREEHLQRAMDRRTRIGQAQGILVERYRITPAAAFDALSRHSQLLNRKVFDLADELVTTGTLPGLIDPTRQAGT